MTISIGEDRDRRSKVKYKVHLRITTNSTTQGQHEQRESEQEKYGGCKPRHVTHRLWGQTMAPPPTSLSRARRHTHRCTSARASSPKHPLPRTTPRNQQTYLHELIVLRVVLCPLEVVLVGGDGMRVLVLVIAAGGGGGRRRVQPRARRPCARRPGEGEGIGCAPCAAPQPQERIPRQQHRFRAPRSPSARQQPLAEWTHARRVREHAAT